MSEEPRKERQDLYLHIGEAARAGTGIDLSAAETRTIYETLSWCRDVVNRYGPDAPPAVQIDGLTLRRLEELLPALTLWARTSRDANPDQAADCPDPSLADVAMIAISLVHAEILDRAGQPMSGGQVTH